MKTKIIIRTIIFIAGVSMSIFLAGVFNDALKIRHFKEMCLSTNGEYGDLGGRMYCHFYSLPCEDSCEDFRITIQK